MKRIFFPYLVLAIVFTGLVACEKDEDVTAGPQTIAEIASADARFSTLVSALERTNLVDVLNATGSFTVFAPTNDAFSALGVDLSAVSDEALAEILLYHVLGAAVQSGNLGEGQTYASTAAATGPGGNALSVLIEKSGGAVKINGKANVTTADVQASNGVIHIIDAVITPMSVVDHALANENFVELVGALGSASGGLVDVLSGEGPFTVFAPINPAFEAIAEVTATLSADQLAGVLTYHVVAGANVRSGDLSDGQVVQTVNGSNFTINLGGAATITDEQGSTANIVLTDVQATNGVIHVLDKIILPTL